MCARAHVQEKEPQSKKLSKYDFCRHGKIIGFTDIILAVRIGTSLNTREFFPVAELMAKLLGFFQTRCFQADMLFAGFVGAHESVPKYTNLINEHWIRDISYGKYKIFLFSIKHMGQIRK